MPAQVRVSVEDVVRATAILSAAGRSVTGWSLRRVLGAGRPERLAAIAHDLAENATTAPVLPVDVTTLPPVLTAMLSEAKQRFAAEIEKLLGQTWSTGSDIAGRRVADEIAAARTRVAQLESDLAEAETIVSAHDAQVEKTQAEAEAARESVAAAEAVRVQAERATHDSAIRLDEVRKELEARELQLRVAADQIVSLSERATTAETRAALAEAQVAALTSAQITLNRQARELDARLEHAEVELRQAQERHSRHANAETGSVVAIMPPSRTSPAPAVYPSPIEGNLPTVSDPDDLPNNKRAAYDNGRLCARTGQRGARQFQLGGRLARLRPWWLAGHRDALAAVAANQPSVSVRLPN